MCGIAGAFALDPMGRVDPERVRLMTQRVSHRGPDGCGQWADAQGRVCLGHRRLSVIDLATGAQPMADDVSGVVVTFNGEIYNYRELRAGLAARGAVFRTESDTEVLLRLYVERGEAFLDELRGMFAFAIWDPRAGSLLLARDRIGKKPLYHAIRDGVLYFASSFAAVREGARLDGRIDVPALDELLTLSYIPSPRTMHPDLAKLPAASVAIADDAGLRVRRYWDLAQAARPFEGTWEEAVDTLDANIRTAVSIRLRSDVPLGIFLSGGVDSSLVAAIAAQVSTTPVLTFAIGFDEAGYDERAYAAEVARRIGSEHRAFRSRFDSLHLLPELVRHFGEPFGDSSAIPTWLLSARTREHVTVALGGDGGDEGFGGYNWYGTAERIGRLARAVPGPLARVAARALARRGHAFGRAGRLMRALSILGDDEAGRASALRSFVDPVLARRLFAGPLLEAHAGERADDTDRLIRLYRECEGSSLVRARITDFRSYLADCLMPKVDVASMAHALEVRAPLLDHEVVTFALGLPDAWIREGRRTKRILTAVLDRYLPASFFDRPKQGFAIPLATWFRRELRPVVSGLPGNSRLLDHGWFQASGLRSIVEEHMTGRRDHSQRIYTLLVLDEWLAQQA